jgi:hypothetical protein
MHPLLKKVHYKSQSRVLLLDVPPEVKNLNSAFEGRVDKAMKGKYAFVLAFAKSLAEGESFATRIGRHLVEGAHLWLAYPKGTSKKYKGADINRDSGNAMMGKHGFKGVSLVAIDEDWSAMRFTS